MKKKRRIENRIIAVILCMAILFSQVNIADAADLNPSGTNTSQVVLSDETNMSNDEASTESTVSDEINGTTESESSISEETNENSKNNESKSSNENVKAESTDNIDAYYKDSKICIYSIIIYSNTVIKIFHQYIMLTEIPICILNSTEGSMAFIASPSPVLTTHPFCIQGPSGESDSAIPI